MLKIFTTLYTCKQTRAHQRCVTIDCCPGVKPCILMAAHQIAVFVCYCTTNFM